MILKNGSQPLIWTQSLGKEGERNYLGVVLAEWDTIHPYVVWKMASDDGDKWETYNGHYCKTFAEAEETFKQETIGDYRSQMSWLFKRERKRDKNNVTKISRVSQH